MSRGLFAALYESAQPFALIDSRERREHVNGHWFGSTNIPLSVLATQISRLIPCHDFPIHLLDWQDTPSGAAAESLAALGYHKVRRCPTRRPDSFGDGFVKGEYDWSKAFGEVVAHSCGLTEITPQEYLAHHKHANLFDVRPTAEYSQFTIPGSQSLPNSLLLANTQALTRTGNTALLHCAGRTRSIIGACTLKAAGYSGPFAIFKGGTQAWQLDGLAREFNAQRLFAQESENAEPVKDFLSQWNIHYRELNNNSLEDFIAEHAQAHLFDVSDDAATGQTMTHRIIKVSGTNLIQQTDRSIARYHVPVILFDHGSGSRAAFAAYWLQMMGYQVSVVYLDTALTMAPQETDTTANQPASFHVLNTDQLLQQLASGSKVLDFRPSKSYASAHLIGSHWKNISQTLAITAQNNRPVTVIGNHLSHATDTATLLHGHGWQVHGIYGWNKSDIDPAHTGTGAPADPVDQSALFAGRHHGNMQDSRDYLAWEEALPGQIDQTIHQQWRDLFGKFNDIGTFSGI